MFGKYIARRLYKNEKNVCEEQKMKHHALEDAIQQAKEFERVLELMKAKTI